jgi:hypothetical protein
MFNHQIHFEREQISRSATTIILENLDRSCDLLLMTLTIDANSTQRMASDDKYLQNSTLKLDLTKA